MTRAMITVATDDITIERDPIGKLRVKDDGITAAKIKDGEVKSGEIASGAVGSAEIATDAVTADEIVNEVWRNKLIFVIPTYAGDWEVKPTALENATDNCTTTVTGEGGVAGVSPGTEGTLNFDMGAIYNIKLLNIKYGYRVADAGYTATFRWEISTDGTTWTTVDTKTSASTSETIARITLRDLGNARYIRLRLTAAGVYYRCFAKVYLVQAFGG